MRSILIFLWTLSVVSLSAQDNETAPDRWTPDDIIFTEYLSSPAFSNDGQMVVWTKRRGDREKDKFLTDLYLTRLDLVKDDRFRTFRLTNEDESDSEPLFAPDGETVYFLSSRDEGKKLWALSTFGGEPQEVHEFKESISDLQWLNDSTLTFVSEEGKTLYEQKLKEKKDNTVVVEDEEHWDPKRVYSFDLKNKTIKRLTSNKYPVRTYRVSRDGKWMVYSLQMSRHYPADGQPYPEYFLLELDSGQPARMLE